MERVQISPKFTSSKWTREIYPSQGAVQPNTSSISYSHSTYRGNNTSDTYNTFDSSSPSLGCGCLFSIFYLFFATIAKLTKKYY